jgi:hypothetical protein
MSSRLTASAGNALNAIPVEIYETFIPPNASYLDGYCRAQVQFAGQRFSISALLI